MPPWLLLHGYPQTQIMWHKIAPALDELLQFLKGVLASWGQALIVRPPMLIFRNPGV